MILVISSANVISGAEYVLKDYIKRSNFSKNIDLLIANSNMEKKENKNFYTDLGVNKVYSTKYMNPLGASKNKFKAIKKIINLFMIKSEINNILKNNLYEYVLGNNTSDMVYSYYSNKNNIKHYQYIHDIILENSFWHRAMMFLDKNIYKYIAVSEAVKKNLIKLGIKESKIELVYNGIKYKNIELKKYNPNKIKIGFVGSLIERKSPQSFLKLADDPTFNLNFVYNLVDDNILAILEKHNNINLLGKKDRRDLDEFYKEMDFILVPSKKDPLPTVVLESFNNSTPVIGRNIDGIPEMIIEGQNGFLFNKDDELKTIKECLKNIDDRKYRELCTNSNKTIKNKFNINNKVEKLDKMFFK